MPPTASLPEPVVVDQRPGHENIIFHVPGRRIIAALCAGRVYGPWWLYAGSALMLAEYLMLALSVGLLGRAARRLERHTRVQRHLIEFARGLARTLDPGTVLRTSTAAMASSRPSPVVRSPGTPRAPAGRAGDFPRERTRTSKPAFRSSGTSPVPSAPVPPVTRTFMLAC